MLLLTCAISALFAIMSRPSKKAWSAVLPGLALLVIYGMWCLISGTESAIAHTASLFASLSVFLFSYQFAEKLSNSRFVITSVLILCAGAILVSLNFSAEEEKNNISGYTSYVFLISATIIYSPRTPKRSSLIFIIFLFLCAAVSVLMDHRAMLGIILVAVFLFLLGKIPFLRKYFAWLLPLCLGLGIWLIIITLIGRGPVHIADVNDFFIEHTGRRATSGREIIWALVIDAVNDSPVFGLGGGYTFSKIFDNGWSTHSLYMQIFMQTGYLGLFLLLYWFRNIWKAMMSRSGQEIESLGIVVFLIVVVHSATEVFLIQNLIVIGVPASILLGLAAGRIQAAGKTTDTWPAVRSYYR